MHDDGYVLWERDVASRSSFLLPADNILLLAASCTAHDILVQSAGGRTPALLQPPRSSSVQPVLTILFVCLLDHHSAYYFLDDSSLPQLFVLRSTLLCFPTHTSYVRGYHSKLRYWIVWLLLGQKAYVPCLQLLHDYKI